MKKVLIITINYNQSQMTVDCVNSILKSDYENYKLIVVDNGSNKVQYEYLNEKISDNKIVVERIENNCGYVGGVNHGLSVSKGYGADYYLIMNNDTIIDKNAIKELVKCGNDFQEEAIISGKVYHFDRPNILQYVGEKFIDKKRLRTKAIHKDEKDIGQCDEVVERDMLDDIFWLLPNKIYQKVGKYSDNYFLYAEQADYALNVVRNGFKLVYTPKAKIWHKGSLTTGSGNRFSPPVNFWRKKSTVIYLYRNTTKKYFWPLIIKNISKLSLKSFLSFLRLRNKDRKSEYAAWLGTVYGLKWVFSKKPDNGYNPFINKS